MDTKKQVYVQDILKIGEAIIPRDKIPEIDLYMDQLTTFMDDKLKACKRAQDEKILTKTMINNYSKDKMLPASVNKKYSRTHMMMLVLIYQLKATLSISDIQLLLANIGEGEPLAAMYDAFTAMQAGVAQRAADDLPRTMDAAASLLPDGDENAQALAAVLELSLEAAAKKRLAERILDSYFAAESAQPEKAKPAEKTK